MERFWAKVQRSDDGCWEWLAGHNSYGYGVFRIGGRTLTAHRVAWELTYGEQPDGHVLHRCDNRNCVRPDHLFLGTWADNNADAISKHRHAYGVRVPTAKLDEAAIPQIVKAYDSGMTQAAVGEAFGITQSNVSRILAGKAWRLASRTHP